MLSEISAMLFSCDIIYADRIADEHTNLVRVTKDRKCCVKKHAVRTVKVRKLTYVRHGPLYCTAYSTEHSTVQYVTVTYCSAR